VKDVTYFYSLLLHSVPVKHSHIHVTVAVSSMTASTRSSEYEVPVIGTRCRRLLKYEIIYF